LSRPLSITRILHSPKSAVNGRPCVH